MQSNISEFQRRQFAIIARVSPFAVGGHLVNTTVPLSTHLAAPSISCMPLPASAAKWKYPVTRSSEAPSRRATFRTQAVPPRDRTANRFDPWTSFLQDDGSASWAA